MSDDTPDPNATFYLDVDVIVEGALDENRIFTDQAEYDRWLEQCKLEVGDVGVWVEVYCTPHEHPLDEHDCECAQFLTDHKPDWSNRDD